MRKNRKTLFKVVLVAAAIATPIVYAYEYGPDPGYSGAPGDNATGCIQAGCHTGTPNTGGGKVTIAASGGTTYVPGQPQTISVTIMDSLEKGYGFQLSARVDSSPKTTEAGLLTPGSDGFTQVLCADSSTPPATGCTAAHGGSVEWIEHTLSGWENSGTPPSHTYTFNWMPPAANVGTVTLYAAGNAGTTTSQITAEAIGPGNTHVYLSSLQLSPGLSTNPNAPTINMGGVNPIYSPSTTIQPGSWVQIYGNNLASALTLWNGDFPKTLGGTSVTVNNKPAYLYFVSPGQINIQAPDDTASGSVPLVVTTGNGSASTTVTLATIAPSFSLIDTQHVAGIILRSDGSGSQGGGTYDYLGPNGTSTGRPTVPAKAGDTVELFGVGFGPVSPAIPSGQALAPGVFGTATTPNIQLVVNGTTVTPSFVGITEAGLFQINLKIPPGLGKGDVPLLAMVGGATTQSATVISLQ